MSFGDKLLFFFSTLGVFNGLILSIYFLFFSSAKRLSNYFLGILLLMLSIRVGKSVAFSFSYALPKLYLQIGLSACFFIGPFLFFFIKSETQKITKMPLAWIYQLVGLGLILFSVGIIYPYQQFPIFWGEIFIPIIYLQWGIYIVWSILLLKPLIRRIIQKDQLKPFEKWVIAICGIILVLFLLYVQAYLNRIKGSYIATALYFSLAFYIIVFVLLYRKKANDLSAFSISKYSDKKLNTAEVELIVDRLNNSMNEKELYKKHNLKIYDLAKEVKVPEYQLSQILNEYLGKNFTLFVNEFRVDAACKMLTENAILTVDAIGYEVGFNSKSTFFATFKRLKNLTPNAYQQANSPNF